MPVAKSFDQTDGVLARARAVEDIEYKIMVQRATQAAIYYMPAVVMVDFVKGIRRDLGGDINDVAYLKESLEGMVRVCYELVPVLRAVSDAAAADERMAKSYAGFMGEFDDAVTAPIEQLQEEGWIATF